MKLKIDEFIEQAKSVKTLASSFETYLKTPTPESTDNIKLYPIDAAMTHYIKAAKLIEQLMEIFQAKEGWVQVFDQAGNLIQPTPTHMKDENRVYFFEPPQAGCKVRIKWKGTLHEFNCNGAFLNYFFGENQ